MKLYNFNKMKGGWYIGNFSPTVMKTSKLEVSYKVHKKTKNGLSIITKKLLK